MELLVAFKGWRLDSLMAEGFLEAFSAQDHWYQADAARHKKRPPHRGGPFYLLLAVWWAGGNRTRVRQQPICRSTCLARSI